MKRGADLPLGVPEPREPSLPLRTPHHLFLQVETGRRGTGRGTHIQDRGSQPSRTGRTRLNRAQLQSKRPWAQSKGTQPMLSEGRDLAPRRGGLSQLDQGLSTQASPASTSSWPSDRLQPMQSDTRRRGGTFPPGNVFSQKHHFQK